MKLTVPSSLLVSLFVFGCAAEEEPTPAKKETAAEVTPPVVEEEPAPAEEPEEIWEEQFGDDLEEGVEEIEFTDLAARAAELDGQEFITRGTLRASCTKRGCWMEVRPTADRNGTGLTTRFKNYGFFVPLNSRGAEVKFQFKVNATQLTAAQVKEFEAEGGVVSDKQADGTAAVIELTSSGVLMRGRKK